MTTKTQKELARFHSLDALVEEISDALAALKAERAILEDSLLAALAAEDFDLWAHKRLAAGRAGSLVFTVAQGEAIARVNGKSTTDADWLKGVVEKSGYAYVRTKHELDKRAVQGALASGKLDAAALKLLGLKLVKTQTLSVRKLRGEDEVRALVEAANAEADG